MEAQEGQRSPDMPETMKIRVVAIYGESGQPFMVEPDSRECRTGQEPHATCSSKTNSEKRSKIKVS